jgi:hypothetical protein
MAGMINHETGVMSGTPKKNSMPAQKGIMILMNGISFQNSVPALRMNKNMYSGQGYANSRSCILSAIWQKKLPVKG